MYPLPRAGYNHGSRTTTPLPLLSRAGQGLREAAFLTATTDPPVGHGKHEIRMALPRRPPQEGRKSDPKYLFLPHTPSSSRQTPALGGASVTSSPTLPPPQLKLRLRKLAFSLSLARALGEIRGAFPIYGALRKLQARARVGARGGGCFPRDMRRKRKSRLRRRRRQRRRGEERKVRAPPSGSRSRSASAIVGKLSPEQGGGSCAVPSWLLSKAPTRPGAPGLRRQSGGGGSSSSDNDYDLRKRRRRRRRRPKRSWVRGIAAPREECQPPASTRYRLCSASPGRETACLARPPLLVLHSLLPQGIAGIRGRYIRGRWTPPLLPGPPPPQAWRPLSSGLRPPR